MSKKQKKSVKKKQTPLQRFNALVLKWSGHNIHPSFIKELREALFK